MTRTLRPGAQLPTRSVLARNTAADEAGSIHDDACATRIGYRGGLVPGVTLLAYLTPTLIDAFGEAWPQLGRLRARFLRPVYDGEELLVGAAAARRDGTDIVLDCQISRSDGTICVEAEAACRLEAAPSPGRTPWRRGLPAPRRAGPDAQLPALSPETLQPGLELAPLTYRLTLEAAAGWAGEASDHDVWYHESSPFDGPIVHPALFARDPIRLLRHNFAYKAIIHAATDLAYRGVGHPDRDYTVYGYVGELYERKESSYAVLHTLTVDQDGREIVRDRHTSLIKLRAEA